MSAVEATGATERAAFRPGVVLALVLAAVFALSGIAVLGAFAPELDKGDDGRAHALSRSAIGYAGLVRLLRDTGETVVLSRGVRAGSRGDSLLILTPPGGREGDALKALLAQPDNVLLVLPKWQGMNDFRHRGWVGQLYPLPADEALAVLPEALREGTTLVETKGAARPTLTDSAGQRFSGAAVRGLRTLSGPAWTPIVTDAAGRVVVGYHEDEAIYVLADPDLLNTLAMNDAAKARAALTLLRAVGPPDQSFVFDLSLNGFGRPRSVLRLLFEPPLLGFTLCLVFTVGLIGWQAAIRFAPHGHARRAVALGKTALADNTAALVRLARRERSMARPYAELVRARAARAVAAPHNLTPEALTALLDRLAAGRGAETSYAALADQADRASNAHDLMAVARALNRWKSELTRGRG